MSYAGLVAKVEDAIWTELERQRDDGFEPGGGELGAHGPCVSRSSDLIDGYVHMTAVAKAAVAAVADHIRVGEFFG
jgi:hypothetical protein